MICIDASVAAKLVLPEEHTEQAKALLTASLTASEPIVAPALLFSEVTNILRQRVRRGELVLSQAQSALTNLLALPFTIESTTRLYVQALEVAERYTLASAYDAQYVALALLSGATLWTADQRLRNALPKEASWIQWIGDYQDK